MLKFFIFTVLSVGSSMSIYALNAQQQKEVTNIIQLFKTNDIQGIIQHVEYPLLRDAGLPNVQNTREMKQRFDQIFDDKFKQRISKSTLADWSEVGWRGVMFEDGNLWLNGAKITTVNYSSSAEQKYKTDLLQAKKNSLHSSVQAFKQSVLQFDTPSFTIRVDEIAPHQYRYAAWKKNKPLSSKPELVLTQGTVISIDSTDDTVYTFKSGPYQYKILTNLFAMLGADVLLTIEKDNEEILRQDGILTE